MQQRTTTRMLNWGSLLSALQMGDVVDLDPAAFAALEGVKFWTVVTLRYVPHPTHVHIDKALEWIAKLRPERVILTWTVTNWPSGYLMSSGSECRFRQDSDY
jgi:hypothetical protein